MKARCASEIKGEAMMKTQQCDSCEKPTNDYYPFKKDKGIQLFRCVDCHERGIVKDKKKPSRGIKSHNNKIMNSE